MQNEIIDISSINSRGIYRQAKIAGISTVTKLGDNRKQGDARVTIYQLGDVRVANTNGDPIWEESDHAGFAELLESEGILLSEVEITARARAFFGEGVREHRFLVTSDEVKVWDSVAGHYTNCNALTWAAKARIARIAGGAS